MFIRFLFYLIYTITSWIVYPFSRKNTLAEIDKFTKRVTQLNCGYNPDDVDG